MKNSTYLTIIAVLILAAGVLSSFQNAIAQPPANRSSLNVKTGVSINDSKALQGYTLVFPMNSKNTYLIDMEGRIVNEWKSKYRPALSAYLLPNGQLLRPAAEGGGMSGGPGGGGRIQKFTWDDKLIWDYSFSKGKLRPHHDICPLPNGNVLIIASDPRTKKEAVAAGKIPKTAGRQLLADCILEIKPTGKRTGEVVWEWYAWDHLVQDINKKKMNYGEVSEHPELIDINYGSKRFTRMMSNPKELAKLRSLGYVGGGTRQPPSNSNNRNLDGPPNNGPNHHRTDREKGNRPGRGGGPMQGDWMHTNSVAYNADLDQIMLCVHGFSEVWIIDHGTTTAEAASHSRGKCGNGGDLLYRWGNPQAYRNGSDTDQRLYSQHCAHWIPKGFPGEGNMLVFNNGGGRPGGHFSSVDEIELPLKEDGTYARDDYVAYGPRQAKWSYAAKDKSSFYSGHISGTQRLSNGNTLICSGEQARIFEVTAEKEIVWQYKHSGGSFGPGHFDHGHVGEIIPRFIQPMLELTEKQNKQIVDLQKSTNKKIKEVLTGKQYQQLSRPQEFRPGKGGFEPGGAPGFSRSGTPRLGELLPKQVVEPLKLTKEQQNEIANLQNHVDMEIKKILTKDQQEKFTHVFEGPQRGFGPPPFGGPNFGSRGKPDPGRRPGLGGRGPGGGGGMGGLFRSYRYGTDYAAFNGKELTAGKKLEEVSAVTSGRPAGRPGGRQ